MRVRKNIAIEEICLKPPKATPRVYGTRANRRREQEEEEDPSTAALFRALADEVAELRREIKQLRQGGVTINQSGKDQDKLLERRVGIKTDMAKEDKEKAPPSEANSTRLVPSKKAKDLPPKAATKQAETWATIIDRKEKEVARRRRKKQEIQQRALPAEQQTRQRQRPPKGDSKDKGHPIRAAVALTVAPGGRKEYEEIFAAARSNICL